MEGTSDITSLPNYSDEKSEIPAQQNSNVSLNINSTENIKISNPISQQVALDNVASPEQYNEIIASLQKASQSGQTQLPDRNISQNTDNIITDDAVKLNYIPKTETETEKYIDNTITTDEVINYNNSLEKTENSIDFIYQELKIPIIITILYFLFQLPIIQKYLYKVIPGLYKTDGNPNFLGYLLNSILFGSIFYFITKSLDYISSV